MLQVSRTHAKKQRGGGNSLEERLKIRTYRDGEGENQEETITGPRSRRKRNRSGGENQEWEDSGGTSLSGKG